VWHNVASWLSQSTSVGDAVSQSAQNEHLLLAVLEQCAENPMEFR